MMLFRRHIFHLFFGALFIAVTFLVAPKADAVEKIWNGLGGDNNWDTGANWVGGVAPVSGTDSVVFDGTGVKDVTINVTTTVTAFSINSGYAGIITAAANVTVSNGAFVMGAGTLDLGSTTWTQRGDWTYTAGTFTANTSTVVFGRGGQTMTLTGSQTFNNFTVNTNSGSTSSVNVASGTTLTVNGTLTFSNSGGGGTSMTGGTIAAKGTIALASTGSYYGTTVVLIDGTTDQSFTSSRADIMWSIPSVTINKASGNLTLSGTIHPGNNWTYMGMGTGTLMPTTSTVIFGRDRDTTVMVTGSMQFNNLTIDPIAYGSTTITIEASTTLTVNGTLTITSSSGTTDATAMNGGTIAAKGTISLSSTGKFSGTTVILIDGTADQSFTSSRTEGSLWSMPSVQINKSSGTLTLSGIIHPGNNWTYTAGTIAAGTSTVIFGRDRVTTPTITGSMSFNNLTIDPTTYGAATITTETATTLTVNGTLTIKNGGDTSATAMNGGTIAAKGTISLSSTGKFSGTTIILIDGTADQSFTSSRSDTTWSMPSVQINKASGTVTLSGTIHPGNNWTYTAGTVAAGTSTVIFGRDRVTTPTITGSMSFNNLMIDPSGYGTTTITVEAATTLTVNGTLTIQNSGDTSAYTMTGGTIAAKGAIAIADSKTHTGTTTLLINGTSDQTLTGSATSSAGDIVAVTINKASGVLTLVGTIRTSKAWTLTAGILAHDTAATNGLYFITSSATVMSIGASGTWRNYATGGTSTINFSTGDVVSNSGVIDFETGNTCGGAAAGSELIVLSTTSGTVSWSGTGTFTMYDVKLTNQVASVAITVKSGTNVSGNTGSWTFTDTCPTFISIAGTVYTNEGSTPMTSTPTVRVKVNGGGAYSSAASVTDGTYTVGSVVTPSGGDVITVYLDGATEDAVLVTRYSSGNLTGINLYQNRVIIRHEDAGPTTNANLDTWDSGNDADVLFSVTSPNLTVSDGAKLLVWTGMTFTPGGTVTTSPSADGTDSVVDGDVEIQSTGTLSIEANALSVGGDFTNGGTFSESGSPQVTTFTATATGHSIDNGTGNLDNVTFNGSAGGWSFADASNTIAGDVTMTAGTLSGTNGMTVNGGDITGDGAITLTGGTVLLDTAGNFGGATGWTFSALTFGDGSGATQTTATGSGGVTVSGVLTIALNQMLDAKGKMWTLSGTGGTPFVITGTFNDSTDTSTFVFTGNNGAGNTTVPSSTAYNHLMVNNASETYVLGGNATTSGNVTITAGTLDVTAAPYNLTVAGNFANSGTFTARTGTVTLNGAAQQALSGTLTSGSAFYNLTLTNTSGANASDCERTGFTPSVDFNAAATVTNNYTITTALVRVEYNSGSTYTFANINWAGTAGNLLQFRNSATSGTWLMNVSGTQTAVSYVNVSRSDASSGSQISALGGTNTNCSNNTNWLFYISGSLYSQDHAAVDGDLYIYGTYNVPAGLTDYWSYANDFDGTALGGSSRQVDVRLASGATVMVPSGATLQIVGGSGANQLTTISRISTGGYNITVAGTVNAQYYSMNYLQGANGFYLQSGATVTSISNGTFDNLVGTAATNDAFVTVDASHIGADSSNPSKSVAGLSFTDSAPGDAECNIRVSGSQQNGFWNITGSSGAFGGAIPGEANDCEPTASPGEIRWTAGGYTDSGAFISATFDTQQTSGVAYNTILWTGPAQPAGTNVQIQLATSNSDSGPWTYLGDGCTISSYYDADPSVAMEVKCYADHNNQRYFKYKVLLSTSDPAQTPTVTGVVVNYSQ